MEMPSWTVTLINAIRAPNAWELCVLPLLHGSILESVFLSLPFIACLLTFCHPSLQLGGKGWLVSSHIIISWAGFLDHKEYLELFTTKIFARGWLQTCLRSVLELDLLNGVARFSWYALHPNIVHFHSPVWQSSFFQESWTGGPSLYLHGASLLPTAIQSLAFLLRLRTT